MTTENESTLPSGFIKTEIDKAGDAIIAEIAAEQRAAGLAEPEAEAEAGSNEGAGAAADVASETAAGEAAKGAEVRSQAADPAVERGLDRLVAREVELRTREDALKAREAAAQSLEAKVADLEKRQVPSDLVQALQHRPGETLRAVGIDPDQFVRLYLAEKMGEKAPPELRKTIEESNRDRKIAALESELQNYQRAQASQAYVARIEAGAREYVAKLGDSKDAPTVSRVAKANSERVYREIMDEIARDAREKLASGTRSEALTPAEAVKRVETRWAEFHGLLDPKASTNPAAAGTTQEQAKTSSVTPGPKPTVTATKPLAPWQRYTKISDIEDAGLREAMAEFRKVEQGRT